ncbi:hypothetical protein ACFY1A_48195 [Streptomyces sp. NPDC001520]|uniref:hypothetical protein n=1 Tax=Streptomyces sp. NPDC001520 TaxID=3364581 RepID=UPI0036D12C03
MRVTLDLPPEQHRALKRWCAGAAVGADVDQVPMVMVLRLVVELLTEGEPPEELLRDAEIRERLEAALIRGVQRVKDSEASSVRH